MNNKNKKYQIELANTAGIIASHFSLNPTVGQIYGLLYMFSGPISLNEIVEKLGISKGAASTNVRILESWGAVKKVWVDNTRKDYYEANPDILFIVTTNLKNGIYKRISEIKGRLEQIEKCVLEETDADKKDQEFFKERFKNIKDTYESIMDFLDMISGNSIDQ